MIDAANTAWVLICSALVLLMIPGLAFFYGGLVRKKNVAGTLMQVIVTMGVVGVVWVLWGYSLAFGPSLGGLIGNLEWFALSGVGATEPGPYSDTIPHQAFMIFQGMFAMITPAAGFVGVMPALVIGLVAGVVCYWAVELLGKLRIDDSLAVLGVHGIGGTWGAIATGLFVGIGYGALADGVSRGEQILYQLISIGAAWGWSLVATAVILLAIKYTMGLRLPDRDEELGLDLSQHDETAYTFDDR